jgi:hypothetical protein
MEKYNTSPIISMSADATTELNHKREKLGHGNVIIRPEFIGINDIV